MRVVSLLLAVFLWASSVSAGILVLRDGRAVRFAGQLRRNDGVVVFHLENGPVVSLREDAVDWPASARATSLLDRGDDSVRDLLLEPGAPDPSRARPLDTLNDDATLGALVHSGRAGPKGPGEPDELVRFEVVGATAAGPSVGATSDDETATVVDLLVQPEPDSVVRMASLPSRERGGLAELVAPRLPSAAARSSAPKERALRLELLPPDPIVVTPVVVKDIRPPEPSALDRVVRLSEELTSASVPERSIEVHLESSLVAEGSEPVREVAAPLSRSGAGDGDGLEPPPAPDPLSVVGNATTAPVERLRIEAQEVQRLPAVEPAPVVTSSPTAVVRLEPRADAESGPPPSPLETAFQTPRDGEAVFGATTLQVQLASGDAVTAVEYHVDGRFVGRTRRPPWGMTWVVPPSRDAHRVEARVERESGPAERALVDVYGIVPDAEVAVDLVALTVTVTNQQLLFVRELAESDFVIFEQGVSQNIAHFSTDAVPLSIFVLVDLSFSMSGPKLEMASQAVARLAERLGPDDRLGVATFTERLQVLSPLTTDHEAVATALDQAEADGGTAMFDSQLEALSLLRWEGGKRVLIVVGDGEDYMSSSSLDEVLHEAQRMNVAVYSVGTLAYRLKDGLPEHWSEKLDGRARPRYWTDGLRVRGLKFLRTMCEETGGVLYLPKFAGELPYVFAHILSELKSSYSIGYYPRERNDDGGYRSIEVFVNGAGLEARTRKGYYAPSVGGQGTLSTARR